jgi:hypothetical protein
MVFIAAEGLHFYFPPFYLVKNSGTQKTLGNKIISRTDLRRSETIFKHETSDVAGLKHAVVPTGGGAVSASKTQGAHAHPRSQVGNVKNSTKQRTPQHSTNDAKTTERKARTLEALELKMRGPTARGGREHH